MRGRGRRNSALLLPRAAVDRRQLPDVPGRGEGRPEAGRKLRLGRARLPSGAEGRAAGNLDAFADGEEGARRRDGIPADQPPAGLPDLRPGRRVRSAGPGDGLRRRHLALCREQARGRGQISRRAGQDLDEPLHPVHALRPLLRRSLRRAGNGRDRPRRGHGDHDLSGIGADLGIAGQSRRYLPGRRADLKTLCVRGAAVGARQDPVGRRDGWRRLGDPRRYPRPRGDADPAAHQRGRERGMDFRQDPPHRRRPAHAAARPALYPRERPAPRRVVAGGVCGDRRQGRPHRRQADRRRRRRSRRGRGDVRAEGTAGEMRLRQSGGAGRRCLRRQGRPRLLHLQPDHCRHRAGRRAADRGLQPAQGSRRPQRADPQALALGPAQGRRDRRQGRSDL